MTERTPYTHTESFIMHLYWYTQYSMLGIGYWFGKQTVIKKWEITKLEKEVIVTEFHALKAQIDPHFLYNTLNFFYSEALEYSPSLAEGIIDLSDVMRYSIEKKEDHNGEILLIDEITHIEKLLTLFNYRFNDSSLITFNKSGNLKDLKVPPYILTIPIENVFKHGDTTQEIFIDINFDDFSSSLLIYIANSKGLKVSPSTGLGLENLKKRLHYHYADKHILTVNENAQTFEITIEIMY
ncbi:sensor histidine kinase [Chitinophaga sp. LS1]|uniref:sensor histidine kinase n=1 Tax=Chitinophaga sp. LS1 TaxID=3051176 RepID=UPI002AAAE43D|nr:histidine kinase [Chitinophaga sp. LS1]WPV67538.1 histidine kinase [Chitinophaga sp. LS1]